MQSSSVVLLTCPLGKRYSQHCRNSVKIMGFSLQIRVLCISNKIEPQRQYNQVDFQDPLIACSL
jgi:hypothetical protein